MQDDFKKKFNRQNKLQQKQINDKIVFYHCPQE